MQRPTTFRLTKLASIVGVASLTTVVPESLLAQETGGLGEIELIQVTGSRIQRDGYSTPTPVSVLSEEDIQAEAPGSVAEFAMTLPSIQGSSTASSSSGSLSAGRAGISALNLRGLGTGRTLVLLDGQRSVASSATGQVDTNTFPQSLIERIEVVSGGASSAYGSDAIAGVVNFILDKDFTGFDTTVQYGDVMDYDAPSELFQIAAGTPFADGRGHILFSGEMYNQEGILDTAPDWAQNGVFGVRNPDRSEGAPHFYVGPNIGLSDRTPGGLVQSGPLEGYYFGDGGELGQLDYGDVTGQWMIGGDWQYTLSPTVGTNSLRSHDTRNSVWGRSSYELTDSVNVFVQGSWAEYEGLSNYILPEDRNRTYSRDNPFLPAEFVSLMDAEGIDSFVMSTSNADFPLSGTNNMRATTRFVAGADGEFELFDRAIEWDGYYQLGKTNTDEHQVPVFSFNELAMASDAVRDPDSGEIVCRSTLSSPGNGCVPLNRFGVGVANAEGLDYVLGRPRREQFLEQRVAAVNFQTSDIQGWAGEISIAAGVEWREESIDAFVDPKYNSGWKYGNYKVTQGEYTVKEGYIETLVPLWENRLDLNAAARRTNYSTSGSVNTWKVGFTFTPIDDITLRVTQSHDIRAPNLSELFDAGTARTNAVQINGESVEFIQNLQGTPTVGPEEAEGLGVGLILQPRFLPGFAASIDYYDVEVDGVIDFIGAQDVADACYIFGQQRYCDFLRFDSNGVLRFIDLEYENLNSLLSEGVDIETSYTFGAGPGDVSLRLLATNYIERTTDDGVTAVNSAGENSGSTPDWVYRATARYSMNDWMFNLTARGHSDGVMNNAYIECSSNCPPSVAPNFTINDNDIPGEWFFDLYGEKAFSFGDTQAEVFISVKNILDTDPVVYGNPRRQGAASTAHYLPLNRGLMDVLGRNYRAGVRVSF